MRPTLLLLALVPVLLQLLALLNPDVVLVDCEERYNAGHAWTLLQGHGSSLFALQYRPFCGGCTLTAGLGALSMGLLGGSFLAWKAVALGFTAVLAFAGTEGLRRREGPVAASLFLALLAFAPWTWIQLSLLSWGNHYECGVLGVGVLLLLAGERTPRRVALAGLLLGLGLWIGFTMGVFLAGAVLLLLREDRALLRHLLLGVLLAPALWLIQTIAGGPVPFGTIYTPGEATPSLFRVPDRVWSLVAPRQVAGLWGLPRVELGAPLGYACLASLTGALVLGLRQGGLSRGAGLVILCWLAAYLVLGFPLATPEWPDVPPASGLRYFAPVYATGFVLLAAVGGRLWARGRRLGAVLLLLPPLVSGALARAATLTAPFPSRAALAFDPVDWGYFRNQASYLLDEETHRSCPSEDPRDRAVHAYALGRAHGRAVVLEGQAVDASGPPSGRPERPFYEGVGGALVDLRDPQAEASLLLLEGIAEELAALPEGPRALALREVAWRRAYHQSRWSLGRGEMDDAALRRQLQVLSGSSDGLRDAWMSALGRRWGRVQGRWAQPEPAPFPGLRPRRLRAFTEGLGEGMGEEWGPLAALPAPEGLPASLQDELLSGYAVGLDRKWRPGLDSPIEVSQDPWPSTSEERWWGPAPPMLCPCGATCE